MDLGSLIRDVPDFPKEGILFKDITPLLGDAQALDYVIHQLAEPFRDQEIVRVVGMESRGFLFGPGVARILGCGFAPVRKPGRLPYQTEQVTYDLEYGSDTLEIHVDAIPKNGKVLIVDDLLATGGTAAATANLVTKVGGVVAGYGFVIELSFLKGRAQLSAPVHALIDYN